MQLQASAKAGVVNSKATKTARAKKAIRMFSQDARAVPGREGIRQI